MNQEEITSSYTRFELLLSVRIFAEKLTVIECIMQIQGELSSSLHKVRVIVGSSYQQSVELLLKYYSIYLITVQYAVLEYP